MTTMAYIRKRMIDSYDELGPHSKITRTPIIITDIDVMARQLSEVYHELVSNDPYEAREWNDHGDEYLVEPSYALGCYFLERMKELQPLLEAFGIWKDRLSMPYTRDKNGQWNLQPVPCWSATDFGGAEQKEAQAKYGKNSTYVRDELIKLGLNPRHPSRAVCWEHTEYIDRDYRLKHSIHIVRDWVAPDAQDLTYREKVSADNDAEYKAYLAHTKTPEGKAEEEARQQAEADLQTYMGENGLTSYSRSEDGTVTMWRD